MSGDTTTAARRIADAVLTEGYVLFPYRASAVKNRYRWQFGVVVPEAQAADGSDNPFDIQSECLLRAAPGARVEVIARFLHVHRRAVLERRDDGTYAPVERLEVGDELFTTWDEGVEREISSGFVELAEIEGNARTVDFEFAEARAVEPLSAPDGAEVGSVVRGALPLSGRIRMRAERLSEDVVKLSTTVGNTTQWSEPGAPREEVLRHSFVGLHLLLSAHGGAFASAMDPPGWAEPWADTCTNRHTHPVLVGEDDGDDVVLSAPIILYDHPEIAPESAGESFDATEIDELLSLCVSSLTDEEKREARATDPRAAALIDRADAIPPEMLERLHGAVRQFGPGLSGTSGPRRLQETRSPDPRGDLRLGPSMSDEGASSIEEELAAFLGVGEEPIDRLALGDGHELTVGSRVRLAPRRRADAQDVFLAGKEAVVHRIVRAVDGDTYVAVTVADDPGADIHEWYGRFHYFHPEEVEAIELEQ